MKNLELKQMEQIEAGDDCAFHMGVSTGLMVIGIATAFTGVGALFLFAGAGWGLVASNSDMCAGQTD